jgi:hypothetical protein
MRVYLEALKKAKQSRLFRCAPISRVVCVVAYIAFHILPTAWPCFVVNIQSVSGGIVNISGGGSMDYSE